MKNTSMYGRQEKVSTNHLKFHQAERLLYEMWDTKMSSKEIKGFGLPNLVDPD